MKARVPSDVIVADVMISAMSSESITADAAGSMNQRRLVVPTFTAIAGPDARLGATSNETGVVIGIVDVTAVADGSSTTTVRQPRGDQHHVLGERNVTRGCRAQLNRVRDRAFHSDVR